MKKAKTAGVSPEFQALGKVLAALAGLDPTQRSWVVASAVSNLQVPATSINLPNNPGTGGGLNPLPANIAGTPGSKEHAKAFLRQKSPQSDVQRVACLAYYLAKFKDTPEIKTKDVGGMNTLAAGTRISNVSKSLDNATHQNRYFAPAGKGKKQLTAFGELIVEALPDQMKVAEVVAAERPKKRKSSKKKP